MPPLSQMNCHSCHQPIRAGSKFCPLCGAAQAPVTPCPACHAPVVAGKTACPQCGASLDVAVGEPAPNDDLTRLIVPDKADFEDQIDADLSSPQQAPTNEFVEEPDEPFTEMFLESNWQSEGSFSDLSRQIDGSTGLDPSAPADEATDRGLLPTQSAPPPGPTKADSSASGIDAPTRPTSDEDLERTVIMRSGIDLAPRARRPPRPCRLQRRPR